MGDEGGRTRVINLDDVRRARERASVYREAETTTRLKGWEPNAIGELVRWITMDIDGANLVHLHTRAVEPGDTGFAMTPVQARVLALALMEMADDVEAEERKEPPPAA